MAKFSVEVVLIKYEPCHTRETPVRTAGRSYGATTTNSYNGCYTNYTTPTRRDNADTALQSPPIETSRTPIRGDQESLTANLGRDRARGHYVTVVSARVAAVTDVTDVLRSTGTVGLHIREQGEGL